MAAPIEEAEAFEALVNRMKVFVNSDCYKSQIKTTTTKERLRLIVNGVASSLRLEEKNRHLLKKEDLECVIFIVLNHLTVLKMSTLNIDEVSDVELVCECFRLLRNGCAGSRDNQLLIGRSSVFVETLQNLFADCLSCSELSDLQNQSEIIQAFRTLLRCAMQLIGNCVSGCSENVELFWSTFFSLFSRLLGSADRVLSNYTCMVIYNCLTPDHLNQLLEKDQGWSIIGHVLVNVTEGDNEWGLYVIQRILTVSESLKRIWPLMDYAQKSHLLTVVFLTLETVAKEASQDAGSAVMLDPTNVIFISELFSSAVETLLNPNSLSFDVPPSLLCQMVDCLCASSSILSLLSRLQDQHRLVLSSIMLLKAMHCPQTKDRGESVEEILRTTKAAVGLKKDIVQLIGNLVYRHKTNQDLVRESNGIALILDHTRIDETNPFITQWAVFAIRNLCENNSANQQIIADMKLQRLTDDVTSLREHGVQAEIKDGKLIIHPDDN